MLSLWRSLHENLFSSHFMQLYDFQFSVEQKEIKFFIYTNLYSFFFAFKTYSIFLFLFICRLVLF